MPDKPAQKTGQPSKGTGRFVEAGAKGPAGRSSKRVVHTPFDSVGLRVAFAIEELTQGGVLSGSRSRKISTRVDPGLIEAAKRRTGLERDSDLINAALAMIAAGDDFGAWLVSQAGRLPEDFELAV